MCEVAGKADLSLEPPRREVAVTTEQLQDPIQIVIVQGPEVYLSTMSLDMVMVPLPELSAPTVSGSEPWQRR